MKKLLLLFLFPHLIISQTQIGQDIDGASIDDEFGTSVSLSSDGSIVSIGAPFNASNGSFNTGQVRIYENISGVWTQIGNDIYGASVGDRSGFSVSLSSDGFKVAIGSPYNADNGALSGHVRVFENISGVWTQIGNTIIGESNGDLSGFNVSLSSDGSVLAIGAVTNSGFGPNAGHVRIYKDILGVWTQIGNDINGEASSDFSGGSICLSSDGNIIAIGANRNDGNGIESGHVRVFENISGVWTQVGNNINGEVANDRLGYLSLSSDGSIVAVSTPHNNGNGIDSGHVRVYKNISGVWTQIGQDIDGEAAGDYSGLNISLSSNGSILAIGAQLNSGNGIESGHVRVYKNISGVWTQISIDINGEAAGDKSGSSVSLSSNGDVLAIGARENDGNGNNSGHVRVYDLSTLLSLDDYLLSRFSLEPNPAKTHFNIHLKDNIQLIKTSIYNNLGQLIKEDYKKNINVSSFSKGIYFVEIITNKGKASKKIIIE